MLFAANIGNTTISTAAFEGRQIQGAWRVPLQTEGLDALWRSGEASPYASAIGSAIISGVNPPHHNEMISWASDFFGLQPDIVETCEQVPLRIQCEPPESVGIDRLVNGNAAHRLYPDVDLVVVDFGTAMSFSVVSNDGEFLGGAIAPGLAMSARALHEQTAALPQVTQQRFDTATGKSTTHAINTGLSQGLSGSLDRILDGLCEERPGRARILGTGGDLDWFLPLSNHTIEPRPHLTLEGMAFLHSHLHCEGQ